MRTSGRRDPLTVTVLRHACVLDLPGVAERVRSGAEVTAETVSNVTVAVALIDERVFLDRLLTSRIRDSLINYLAPTVERLVPYSANSR